MEAGMVLGVVVVGVLIGAVVVAHRRGTAREAQRLQHERTIYHGVTIVPGEASCAGAQMLKGVRFLGREAPALPLAGCAANDCGCVYQHFDDRRHRNRRDPYLNKVYLAPEELVEHRQGSAGRRKTDQWAQVAH